MGQSTRNRLPWGGSVVVKLSTSTLRDPASFWSSIQRSTSGTQLGSTASSPSSKQMATGRKAKECLVPPATISLPKPLQVTTLLLESSILQDIPPVIRGRPGVPIASGQDLMNSEHIALKSMRMKEREKWEDWNFLATPGSSPVLKHGFEYTCNNTVQVNKNRWLFAAFLPCKPKERVKIIFEEIDFQKGDVSCLDREDVIKVHDGGSALSPVIAVLCNQMSRTEIISSSHQLFIEMATSSYWPGHGFVASYHFLTLESRPEDEENKAVEGPAVSATRYSCEVLIRSEYRRAGTVTSPGYPGPNLSGSRCRFAFIGSGKERIRIHVKHYNPSLYSCGIQLFNHMEGKLKPIPIPCLQPGPWLPIMSSGHRLEIDLDNETTIFRAEYIFLKNYGIKTGRQLSEYPCAFRYSADDFLSGSFHSPNFPGPYPIATECHYFFHGARGHRIRIHFSYFDMDGISPCNSKTRSDYIEFFNFPDRLSRRHCGQLEPFEVLLERRFFRVTFRSGTKRGMGTGFNASYQFLSYPKPAHHGLLPVSSSAISLNGISSLVMIIAIILF